MIIEKKLYAVECNKCGIAFYWGEIHDHWTVDYEGITAGAKEKGWYVNKRTRYVFCPKCKDLPECKEAVEKHRDRHYEGGKGK